MTCDIIRSLVLLTHLLLMSNVRSSVSVTPVTCSAPLSAVGHPSDLTCFFQRDLHASKSQIMVVRHSFGASNDDLGKDVLTCTRRVHSDALRCEAMDGYIFDGKISDRLTLHIPSATNDTAGQYLCHVIPPDGCVAYPCALAVYENQEVFPPQSKPDQKQDTISLTTIFLLINVCIVLIATSCAILIFHRHRLRHYLVKCRGDINEDEDQRRQSGGTDVSIPLKARETTEQDVDSRRLDSEAKRCLTKQPCVAVHQHV